MPHRSTVTIRRVAAFLFRAPIERPVRTSFGVMTDRPMLYLRVEDHEGATGLGEVWCNFPSVGAEHRKHLAETLVAPVIVEIGEITPGKVYATLMDRLHVLGIQSGEWGPLRQVSAGLDAACHDLAARRSGLPLYRYLNDQAADRIRCYASGIGPESPDTAAAEAMKQGHVAFKVKVGFGVEADDRTLANTRAAIGPGRCLMADANQAWDIDRALALAPSLSAYDLTWLEEPLRADRPTDEWQRLAAVAPMPLAAGENLARPSDFDAAMTHAYLSYLQPDVAKWGGVSGCFAVARQAEGKGLVYCPHFLGGAVGLMTSAHLLAAVGGSGFLEVDVNPNDLRDAQLCGVFAVQDGKMRLGDRPGIGIDLD